MKEKFVHSSRDQLYLLPPSIQEWLPEKHLARFIVDVIEQLNLSKLSEQYEGRGKKAYHPEIMLGLLFYGYANGVFSSRKIEQATYDSVAFRFISADTHPDHDTIANFRKRFLKELSQLFVQILVIAGELGVLKIGKVSLDGTKIKANASKHHAMSWEYACKLEEQLHKEVNELMELAEKADSERVNDGMDIPEELSRRKERLDAIAKAKAKIQKRSEERDNDEKLKYEEKMERRKENAKKRKRNRIGHEPKPPIPGPRSKDQINLTDEDSRIMPTSSKTFEQAYNAQITVSTEDMMIIECHVSQSTNDKRELVPSLENIKKLPENLGKIDILLADAGYYSEENVLVCESNKVDSFIPPDREKHHISLSERFSDPAPLLSEVPSVQKMRHKLNTIEGRKIYSERKSTVEPVFGIIKQVLGFRQFHLRGLESVNSEWNLVSIAWNLKRMFALNS